MPAGENWEGIVRGKSFAIFLFYFVKEERRMRMERGQCCEMTGKVCLIRVEKETERGREEDYQAQ